MGEKCFQLNLVGTMYKPGLMVLLITRSPRASNSFKGKIKKTDLPIVLVSHTQIHTLMMRCCCVYLQRFGPPDQQYYTMNSDDPHPGDSQLTQGLESDDNKGNDWTFGQISSTEDIRLTGGCDYFPGNADRAALRKRGTKNKSDLDLKVSFSKH